MGTINYKTSDYITLGYEPLTMEIYETEQKIENAEKQRKKILDIITSVSPWRRELDHYIYFMEKTVDHYDAVIDELNGEKCGLELMQENDFLEAEYILKQYDFTYFHVVIEPGYYEGFSVNIENNHGYCYNDYSEKKEALKEVKQVRNFLRDIVHNANLVQVHPGWSTSYETYLTTLQNIDIAIFEMIEEVENTPTYYQLQRAGEI